MAQLGREWINILDPDTWTTSRTYIDAQPIWQVCFAGDRCYIGTSPSPHRSFIIAAINLVTGRREWAQPSEMVVDIRAQDQTLLAATQPAPGGRGTSAWISLLDSGSGITKWTVPAGTEEPHLGPVVRNRVLAQVSFNGPQDLSNLDKPDLPVITVCMDIETGAEVFRCELPGYTAWIKEAGEGIVLSSHGFGIFALDLNRIWMVAYGGNVRGTPAAMNDSVALGNADGRLLYISSVDGHVRWTANLPAPIEGGPAINGSRVFSGHAGGVSALDMAAGTVVWTRGTTRAVTGPIAVYGQSVVFGARDGCVYAVSSADGQVLWTYQTGGYVEGGVAFDGSSYYAGSADGCAYALTRDGTLKWKFTPQGREVDEFKAVPLVALGLVLVGNAAGYLFAIRQAQGDLVWKIRLDSSLKNCAPLLHTEHIWIASESGRVYRIAVADGTIIWTTDVHGAVRSQPLWRQSVLFVGTGAGTVAVLDIWTGAIKRTISTDAAVVASPLSVASTVLITDERGTVTSLAP